MSKLICKTLHHVRSAVRASQTHNRHLLQIQPFSSSSSSSSLRLESFQKSTNQTTFTVDYLINSCGFSQEAALSVSKYLKFGTPDRPDSVQAFFKSHGFTKAQIKTLITKCPPILSRNPEISLLPKLEFLKSKGFSSTDIARLVSATPGILTSSLENRIVPAFNALSDLLQSEVKAIAAFKRFIGLRSCDFQGCMASNVEILREVGVPHANIVRLVANQPRTLVWKTDRFRKVVEEVEKMGFDPVRVGFIIAVQALGQMSKSKWEKKVAVYKKWGLSEDEILVAFRQQPWCMVASEDKIEEVMDFIINIMGQEYIVKVPPLLSLSLKKRIVPRFAVYQVLLSKGLVKANDMSLSTLLKRPENWFLEKVVNCHKEEAPELLKLYKKKLDLAN